MKRAIIPLLLLTILSIGFSNPVSEFVSRNLNFVVAAVLFVLVFGISMGAASIWVDKPGEVAAISFGVSALVSITALLNPGLSELIHSIITYSPIFIIAFILIALLLIVLFAKKRKQKGLAAAILIAAMIGIIIINGGFQELSDQESQQSPGQQAGFLILGLIGVILLVIGIIALAGKTGKNMLGGGSSSALAKTLNANPEPSKKKQDTTEIHGQILEYNIKNSEWKSAKKSLDSKEYKIMLKCKGMNGDGVEVATTDKDGKYKILLSDKTSKKELGNLGNTWDNLEKVKIFFKKGDKEFYNLMHDEGFTVNSGDHFTGDKAVNIGYFENIGAIIKGKMVEYEKDKERKDSDEIKSSGWKIGLFATKDLSSKGEDLSETNQDDLSGSYFKGRFAIAINKKLLPLNDAIVYAKKGKTIYYMTDWKGKNHKGEKKPFKIEENKEYAGIEIPFDTSANILNVKVKEGETLVENAKVTILDDSNEKFDKGEEGWGKAKTNKHGFCNFRVPQSKSNERITLKIKKDNATDSKILDGVEKT